MVIVIIAILSIIVIPRFINLRKDAQRAACAGIGAGIRTALAHYYARQAVAGTAKFPFSLHDSLFLSYLTEGTLPKHPLSWDWNSYYSTSDSLGAGLGPESGDFLTGVSGGGRGACTAW